jgi:hypothetical protein
MIFRRALDLTFLLVMLPLILLFSPSIGLAEEGQSEKIRDNLFLLEEAYNQETGVIQHIQTFDLNPRNKSWIYTFTEEWPVLSDRNQLSLTIPAIDQGDGGPRGIGDLLINYRFQAVGAGNPGKIAMAPRLSVSLPTGKYQTGNGRGGTGVQVNIPVSIELGSRFVTHWNAGFTETLSAKSLSGYSASAFDVNAGAALVWLAHPRVNPLIELVSISTQDINDNKSKSRSTALIVNPGLRFAINYSSGLQIVPGISIPIQREQSKTATSVLFYLSFEHPLKRKK